MSAGAYGNWHRIWSNRPPIEVLEGSVLQRLISMDGFDSPLGLMKESQWREYVALFSRRAGIRGGDSIFEVGCGTGAFLYVFYLVGHEVGGIDYSSGLIDVARSVMPPRKTNFDAMEASRCPIEPKADVVVANHVMHYFPSIEYSSEVIKSMLSKAVRVVAVSGIPDAELRNESEKERRGLLTNEDYEEKYQGLEILYYKRQWFSDWAARYGFTIQFFRHEMPSFAQNRFRYDCIMTRT